MKLLTALTQPVVRAQMPGEKERHARGRWLLLTRVIWIGITLLALGLYVASIPAAFASLHVLCTNAHSVCSNNGYITPGYVRALQALGFSLDTFATYEVALLIVFAVVYVTIGAVLFWHKSDDHMALFASLTLVTFPAAFNYAALSTLPSAWWLPSQFMILLGNCSLFLFFYLFPTGRFVPRWTIFLWVGAIVFWVVDGFFPTLPFRHSFLRNMLFLGFVGSLSLAQLYRYCRVSNTQQRQQTKWVVFSLSLGLGGFLGLHLSSAFFPLLLPPGPRTDVIISTAESLFLLFVPLSIGIAILRSRLFDIDSIINRTLVYGLLTVGVVVLYVLVVGYLGTLFRSRDNVLISLVATGLIAVLFHPFRVFLQRGVNHLLYGQRDEPYTVITRLSQRLEGTVAPDAVLSTIVETVAQALKLPYVALLFKQEEPFSPVGNDVNGLKNSANAPSFAQAEEQASLVQHVSERKEEPFALVARYGRLVGEPLILPLVYQAETVGQLQLAPRTPGEALTPADRRLLDELARQAGLATHAIQLTGALRHSHELLEQRVEERTRELSSLLEISHTVASTLQLKPLLCLVLDQLKTIIGYTSASIFSVEGEYLIFLDSRSPLPEKQGTQLRFPLQSLEHIWQTLTAHKTIILQDIREKTLLAQDIRMTLGDVWKTSFHDVHACLLVPLMLKEQVIGVLVLTSSEENAFTPHHATLALAIANQAAIAMENAHLYEQAQQLAAVNERQRLARELHDSVSQALYGIALGLHTAHIQLDRDPIELPGTLDYLLSLAEAALDEMHALIFELHPEALEREGLVGALFKQGAALQARHGITVQTDLCEEPDLSLTVKQELYRIAQEAMHNTVKHVRANKIELRLSQSSNEVILQVRDDGVGFDPLGSFPGHLGLHTMQERVSSLGGGLQIESSPGQGTSILIRVPEVA